MKSLGLRFLVSLAVMVFGISSLQAQYVFVDDNNSAANTATSFLRTGPTLSLIAGSPFATNGTGFATYFAANHQAAIAYGPGFPNCLFVSDPGASSGFPFGDVASFVINPSGTLTYVGNATDPTNNIVNKRGLSLAVDRRVGFPYLFASFTGTSHIAFFKVNFTTCQIFFSSATTAIGVNGGAAEGMAVSLNGPHVLVVAFSDGSVQSFKILGGTLAPTAPPFNSTGFINQSAQPAGVDITKNGKYAIFGDNQFNTEVEVSKIMPGGVLAPTVDYGGAANASGVNLGPGSNSNNVWISPAQVSGHNYVYVSNNYSGQVTTIQLVQTTGVVSAIPPGSCTGAFTNPTTLQNPFSSWTFSAGIHTLTTSGAGGAIAVAEYGVPSTVALVKVQAPTGCTRETPLSPFADPNSNNGLYSVSVFPTRPF